MPFGVVAVGAPGSGKSTFCHGIHHFFELTGRRAAVVNLDPANDALPYECAVDVMDLVALEEVMRRYQLGPNGGASFSPLDLPAVKPACATRFLQH